jgi:hypothetical protein
VPDAWVWVVQNELYRSDHRRELLSPPVLLFAKGRRRRHEFPHPGMKNLLFPNGDSDPRSDLMPVEVDGRLIDDTTILLDQPLRRDEESVIVRLKKQPRKMTKLYAPEEYVLALAEKDLEELY